MQSRPANNTTGGGNSPTNYEIIDAGKDQISIVHILDGKFRGVQFRFGEVALEDGRLSFKTEFVKKPWRLMFTNLKENDLFTEVSGNILVHLIQTNANECHNFLVG